jgi:hypothetical protein
MQREHQRGARPEQSGISGLAIKEETHGADAERHGEGKHRGRGNLEP